ncbi:MAG: glycosyltransferase family 1 protein [Verrucomicrobiales bacterium]|nr:glycosyltransferase family 1 protein [Verrucomicrobiales bacterium]
MRIGFDVSSTCQTRTGCAWYADRLIRAMVAAAPEHHYALLHHFDRVNAGDPAKGTQISESHVSTPFDQYNASQSVEMWEAIRGGACIGNGLEIVHSTSFQAPPLSPVKLVYTVFDITYWIVPEYTTEANRFFCQRGTLEALKNADGLIFISESARDEFEGLFPGWLAKRGIPHEVTALGGGERLLKQEERVPVARGEEFWLSVGALEERKNFEGMFDALEIYWEKSENPIRLKIAGGETPHTAHIKDRIDRLEARGMVEYLGYVSEEELSELYLSATALLFPSWYEGFGLPVLEAMSAGCPVITSHNTSIPEVAGKAALYIDPGSADTIASAMLRIQEEPETVKKLMRAGRERASGFTWSSTAERTLNFYKRVLSDD